MKYLNLETFSDFKCTGSECPYTCCGGGWDIYIDEKTMSYYQSQEGEMGERLQAGICKKNGKSAFILTESGNCPFLNQKGLCDIYINLGEEHLSDTCTVYPRYTSAFGDVQFAGVSISCPVVASFFLSHTDPLQIDFAEDDSPVHNENSIDWALFNYSIRSFICAVGIAQNRYISIRDRITLIVLMTYEFQNCIDTNGDPTDIIELFNNPDTYESILSGCRTDSDDTGKSIMCNEILNFFSSVRKLDKDFPEMFELITYFSNPDYSNISRAKWSDAFNAYENSDNQFWQEQVLVYVLYRYYMQGFADRNFYEKLLIGIELVYSMYICILALMYISKGNDISFDEKTLLLTRISRMMEHASGLSDVATEHFRAKGLFELQFVLNMIN